MISMSYQNMSHRTPMKAPQLIHTWQLNMCHVKRLKPKMQRLKRLKTSSRKKTNLFVNDLLSWGQSLLFGFKNNLMVHRKEIVTFFWTHHLPESPWYVISFRGILLFTCIPDNWVFMLWREKFTHILECYR